MKRLYFAVILAGATMVGTAGASWAQMSDTPAPGAQPQTTQPMSPGANAPVDRNALIEQRKAQQEQRKAQHEQMRAQHEQVKAQRVAARNDCRAQGKQQSLRGPAMRDFVKSCVANHN